MARFCTGRLHVLVCVDPYLIDSPLPCPVSSPPGSDRPDVHENPNLPIPQWLILDPNNPLFKPITQIACYFYPLTDSMSPYPRNMEYVYNDYYDLFSSTGQYIDVLKNISTTLNAYKLKLYNITKSQVASFTLHPNVDEERIEADLKYFRSLIEQYSQEMLKIFSKVEIYGEIFETLDIFTKFTLAKLDADDIQKIDLFRLGEELRTETADIERCREGKMHNLILLKTKLIFKGGVLACIIS